MVHPYAKSLLQLIARSEDIGAGWRKVNGRLWAHVKMLSETAPALFELDYTHKTIRMTPDGVVVLEYV